MAEIKKLTARQVDTLSSGDHGDGGNLILRVRDSGSRAWVFRYKKAGKAIEIGLGGTHTRSLASAREVATQMRAAIANGNNPADIVKVKISTKELSFKDCALELIESKRPSWRNLKHGKQWESTLSTYCYPSIGDKIPKDIGLADVLAILKPIWVSKTETASRLRERIEAVLDYASVHDNSDRRNPARWKGNLDKVLPAANKVATRKHHASAPYSDVPIIMSGLRDKDSLSAYCLRFIILTAARSGEGRGALWSEINEKYRLWTIPATRMKADREHVVPLCDEALEIVTKMKDWKREGSDLLFPSVRSQLSDVAVNKVLHSVAPDVTVHGFRSSFRIWGAETTVTPSAVLELALAHVNTNQVEAAYQRSDLLDRRRELMNAWSSYCNSKGNVIQLVNRNNKIQ
jgi:integrase